MSQGFTRPKNQPTGVVAGNYGSASSVADVTVDAYGRITVIADVPIAIAASQVTSGTLPIARGGTNSTTALSGSSIVISNGSAIVQGAAGTATTVLHGNAVGAPTYSAVSLTADVSGILPIAQGGTGAATVAAGLIFVGPASGAAAAPSFRRVTGYDIAGAFWMPVKGLARTNVTVSAPGLSVFNGTSFVSGDRMLLSGQTAGAENGIWIFNGTSSPLTHPDDYPSGDTTYAFFGRMVFIQSGNNSNETWFLNTTGTVTIDTTATAWFGNLTPLASTSGVLAATHGGTGNVGYSIGDILYAASVNPTALTRLAGNTVTTPMYLRQVGNNTNAFAPAWSTLDAGDVTSGTLAVARGGTNSTTALSGSSIMISNGSAIVQGTAGTTTTVLHGNAGGSPTYGAVVLTTDVSGILPVANGGSGVATASAHTFFVGPASGSAAAPTWRQPDHADVASIVKMSARCGSQSNVTVASPGATIDGFSPSAGFRVLLLGQSTGSENGLWVWNGAAVPMTRPEDYASGNTVESYLWVEIYISGGTVLGGTTWFVVTAGTITIDTTATAWSRKTVNINTASGLVGTLPILSGGTGATSVVTNGVVFGSSSTTYSSSANLTWNGATFTVNGATVSNGAATLATVTVKDTANARTICIIGNQGADSGIELGRIDGTASNSFIDFHSSAANVDYNVRMMASGDKAIGAGDLAFTAGTYLFTGTAITTAGVTNGFTFQAGAHTNVTASTENVDAYFNCARTLTWTNSGTVAQNRSVLFAAPTLASASATTTFTKAATVAITGAPIVGANVAITAGYAFWVMAGMTQLDGAINITGGDVTVSAGTVVTVASSTTRAGLRLPHGAAPTSPVNGDMWTTTTSLLVRMNGATVDFTDAASITAGTLSTARGGTGIGTQTTGVFPYYNGSTAMSILAANTTATKMFMSMTSSVPSWVAPGFNDVRAVVVSHTAAILTVAATTDVLLCDPSTLNSFQFSWQTATLPTAVGITGRFIWVMKSDASQMPVVILGTSSQTFNGAASLTLTEPYQWYMVMSDGANWKVFR